MWSFNPVVLWIMVHGVLVFHTSDVLQSVVLWLRLKLSDHFVLDTLVLIYPMWISLYDEICGIFQCSQQLPGKLNRIPFSGRISAGWAQTRPALYHKWCIVCGQWGFMKDYTNFTSAIHNHGVKYVRARGACFYLQPFHLTFIFIPILKPKCIPETTIHLSSSTIYIPPPPALAHPPTLTLIPLLLYLPQPPQSPP